MASLASVSRKIRYSPTIGHIFFTAAAVVIGFAMRMAYPDAQMKTISRVPIFVLATVALLLAHAATPHAPTFSPFQSIYLTGDVGFTLPSRLDGTIRARVLCDQSTRTVDSHSDSCLAAALSDVEKQAFHASALRAHAQIPVTAARVTNNPRDPPAAV